MIKSFLKYFLPEKPKPIPMRHTKEEIRAIALAYAQRLNDNFAEPIDIDACDSTKGWLEGPNRGPVWHVRDGISKWKEYNRHLLIDDGTEEVLKDWITQRAFRYTQEHSDISSANKTQADSHAAH